MRKIVITMLAGCGLLAAAALPALACPFSTQASADTQGQQQTAQAQPSSTTTTQ